MKINILLAIVVAVLVLFIAATPNKKPKTIIDTQVFTCNTSGLAKAYILDWSRKGYKVDHMISQSVSTSIQTRNNGRAYFETYRDIKGDIIIVMTKEIIQ